MRLGRSLRRWVLALGLAACGGGSATTGPDAGTPQPDAMVPGPDASSGIALLDWVDDLVENDTSDTAAPDTVEDKNVIDNDDPNLFDHWLQ